MRCPFCGAEDTKVIDSRLVAEAIKFAVDANVKPAPSVSVRMKRQS